MTKYIQTNKNITQDNPSMYGQGKAVKLYRYENEEGFCSEDDNEHQIVERGEQIVNNDHVWHRKIVPRDSEPKYKLKMINDKNMKTSLAHSIHNREFNRKDNHNKSLDLKKKGFNFSARPNYNNCLIKSKRTMIGENFSISPYALQDTRAIINFVAEQGNRVVFESTQEINTHSFLRRFENKKTPHKTFLYSKYNTLLRNRLKESYLMEKQPKKSTSHVISFSNLMESGNLELVSEISEKQYDAYLRIDTNTHGHQNWFYFSMKNLTEHAQTITIHICNLKRDFKMIGKGQKIFMRKVEELNPNHCQEWKPSGEGFSVKENTNAQLGKGKIYKLSFRVTLLPETCYEIAMLPPYTYSKLLSFIEEIQSNNKLVSIEILTFSLTGLAIPLLTITNKSVPNTMKKVILISGRIHPGESIGSYVMEGLIEELLKMGEGFLEEVIVKIIPMINPDGVVLGNFRTNYLGIDLNRSFHSEDQIINPEVYSLKYLARELKRQYRSHFLYFFDLHGHSSNKNIFSYGPDFQFTDSNFYQSRLLPKLLNFNSKYFKYGSCTFKLEQHKKSTARGFFLTELDVLAYTIQSSYSMYEDEHGRNILLKLEDWRTFGQDLIKSAALALKLTQGQKIKNSRQLKKVMNEQQHQMVKKIQSDLKKEAIKKKQMKERKKQHGRRGQEVLFESDSDGESNDEDLNSEQRQKTEKAIVESSLQNFTLPRVSKPSILYPTITPKLFDPAQKRQEDAYKILYIKRNKYNSLRMANSSSSYTNYLKNSLDGIEGITSKIIKLEKKLQL